MKRIFITICLLLSFADSLMAVDPGGQPTALVLTPGATSIVATFTASGTAPLATGYLVIRNVGGYELTAPVDGTNYTVGQAFGQGVVIYNNSTAGFTDSSLPSGTNFYYTIYAYTGLSTAPDLLVTSPLQGTALTTGAVSQPAAQPTTLSFASVTSSSFNVSFTVAANNPGYIVIRNAGAAPSTAPTDGVAYTVGTAIGNGVVAFVGSGNAFAESGLSAQTSYSYAVYSFNGDGANTDYRNASPLTGSQATSGTSVTPGAQPTALSYSSVTSSGFRVTFTPAASTAGYIAVRNVGGAPSAIPVDGTAYTAGTNLGTGVVAFVGSPVTFVESSLSAGTTYGYSIYSFNGSGANIKYLTTSPLNTPTQATSGSVAQPSAQPTALTYGSVTGSSFNVSFTAAAGAAGYVAVRNVGSAPAGPPVDGTTYSVGDNLGNGVVAFVGSSTAFAESGLSAGTTYGYSIYSFNGNGGTIDYLTTSPLNTPTQATTGGVVQPASQPTALTYGSVTSTGFSVSFTAAAGAAGYVAIRDVGGAPSTAPTDGTALTVGSTLGTGVVAFVGSATSFVESTLSAGTTYGYSIYAFNGAGGTINYLTTSPLNTPTQATTGAVTQPGAQPTSLSYGSVTGSSFTVSYTAASGAAGYIAVRNVGSAPVGAPVDGTTYSVGDNLGNGVVAFVGSATSFAESGLSAGTTYGYAVYAFNGNGASIDYLTTSPLNTPTQATTGAVAQPAAQPTALTYGSVTSSGFSVSFTAAAGTAGYIAIRDVGSAPSTAPTDGTALTVGTVLGTGIVAYVGSATSFVESGLSAGTTYGYSIYAFNGNGATINYRTTSPLNTPTQATSGAITEPVSQPTGLSFGSITGSSYNVSFTAASGAAGYIAIRGVNTAPAGAPVDGTTYSVGNNLGNGIVAFVGSATAFSESGLPAGTTYGYAVYAFNGNGGSINYLTTSPLNTPTVATTGAVVQPGAQPTSLVFGSVSSSGFTVSFTAAASTAGYIVIRGVGAAPSPAPTDFTSYSVGQTIGSGVVAYIGSATSFVESTLSAGTLYGYNVYSFNGSGSSTDYRTATPLTGTQATSGAAAAPTNPPTGIAFSNVLSTSLTVSFNAAVGGAAGYIAIRASGVAPNTAPTNGVLPAQGSPLGNGIVAFVGTGTTFPQAGLSVGTEYFYTIYSFNGAGASTVYNPTALAGSQFTTPSTQALNLVFSNITATSMTVGWTNGNGNRRIVVVRQGGVPASPSDNTTYTNANGNWNSGAPAASDLGSGSFVMYDGTGNSFPITNLVANTSYTFKVFEYTGTSTTNALYGGALVGANNPLTRTTIVNTVPTVQATDIIFTGSGSTTTLKLGWTKGTSTGGRVVLIKTSAFAGGDNPVNGTSYTYNGLVFGSGTVVGGARAVYYETSAGNGSASGPITITGLTAGTTYFVKVFEFDGNHSTGNESYLTTNGASNNPLSRSTVGTSQPASSANSIVFGTATSGSIPLTWTDGSGTGGRIVIAYPNVSSSDPYSSTPGVDYPVDGESYSYNGLSYAAGTPIGTNGARVVYVEAGDGATGTGSGGITITGLASNTQYWIAVVEFDGTPGTGQENYDITGASNNPKKKTTASGTSPVTQASLIVFTPTLTSNTLNLGWTHGSGTGGRILVANTVPITAIDNPTTGVSYNLFNQTFASGEPIGTGTAKVVYRESTTGGTTSGIIITLPNDNTTYYFKVFEFNGTAGSDTENYNVTDFTSNPNSGTTNLAPTATYGVTSGTVGNAGINSDFTITFNTAMRFVNDAPIATDADIKQFVHLEDNTTTSAITFTSSIVGNVITVVPSNSNIGNKLTGSRDYKLYIDANEIETTAAQVPLPASNQVIVATTLPEPTNQPTGASTASTTTSVTVSWTDAVAGAQAPENYLIVGIENGGSFPAVIDGTDPALDVDFSDGVISAKVAPGVQTLLLTTGVKSGQPYDFRIYSYTNESAAINFLTTGPLTASASTSTGSQSVVENGAGSATVSSITNDLAAANAASANFTFDVNDDGAPINDGVDNAPTRVTQLVINRDIPSDQTGDWTTVIAGMVLTDGTNSMNSFATPASFTFAADKITITGIPAVLGTVTDNTTKTFQVKLWLRTDTAPLNIDGNNLAFKVSDGDVSVALVNSSNMAGSGTVSRTAQLAVVATHLAYVQQPTNTSINTSMSPAVTVKGTDVNGNQDFGYVGNISITSSGTLAGTPVTVAAISGVATFSTLSHTAVGTGLILTANGGLPGGTVGSSTFKITASDIVVQAGYIYPQNIPYINYQAPTLPIIAGPGSIEMVTFTLRDGAINGPDADALNTTLNSLTLNISNPGFIRRIALYDAFNNRIGPDQPGAGSVTFPALGIVALDNGTTNFSVRVSFTSSVVDNQQVSFTVTSASGSGSSFINGSAGGAATSTAADNNRIEVIATNFQFTSPPPPSIFANIAFSPALVLQARDVNSIMDADYNGTIRVSNASSLPMTDGAGHNSVTTFTQNFVSGVLSLDNQLRYDIGASPGANGTLTIAEDPVPAISSTSTPIAVNVSTSSDIVADGTFTYPTDIDYLNIQEGSDIVNSTTSLVVGRFILRDGGASSPDADGTPTILNSLTLDLGTNFGFIRKIALYNAAGTAEIPGTEQVVSTNLVTFSGLNLTATDNSTLTFTVRVSFNSTVTDNQPIQFTVNSATVSATRSIFSTGATGNAGGATTSVAGNNNKIEVTATRLDFVSIPAPTTVFISAIFPVTVNARDNLFNLDLDFNATVNTITNSGSLLTNPSPATSGTFTNGVKNFSFQYLNAGIGTLTMTTTGPVINGLPSQTITVQASSESRVYLTGPYSPRIDYFNHQQASNPSTFILAQFTLTDGDADGTPGDADAAPSVLDQLQVSLTNPSFIKRIGVYDDTNTLIAGTEQGGGASLTFSSLGITAPDNGSKNFTIRASFDFNNVVDEQNIQLVVTGATAGTGSGFLTGAGIIGGSPLVNRTTPATGANMMDVVATQLVYTQQPPSIAGTQQPVPIAPVTQVSLEARDANNKLDTEFDGGSNVTFSAPAGVNTYPHPFLDGVANIDRNFLLYSGEGIGTLTAKANNPPPTVVAVSNAISTLVNVYEVRASYTFGGVITPTNLAGGSVDKVIYGVTFSTNHTTAGEPKLRSFKYSFNTTGDLTNVLTNARVFEQVNNINYVGGTDITTFGGSVTINGGAAHTVTVDLTGAPAGFTDLSQNATYTFFLMVDIKSSANSLTPTVEPYMEDLNWNASLPVPAFDATNSNIVVSPLNGVNQGGGRADKIATTGQKYSFAAIFPPKLIASNPSKGAINVDPAGNVVLTFDVPVWSLDKKVKLYRTNPPGGPGTPGTFITDLNLVGSAGVLNPAFNNPTVTTDPLNLANLSNVLTFGPLPGIGTLNYGDLLYVTVNTVDLAGTTGIRDQAGNKFAGIASPGTVYFRIASGNPPVLLSGPTPAVPLVSQIKNISLSGATIQTTFDSPGTAYWVLTNAGAPRPTRAQILGLGNNAAGITGVAYASSLTRGSFPINQIKPAGQYGLISYPFVNGSNYEVWVFAANTDLPSNIPTIGAYGPNPGFAAVADGSPASATFTFTASNPGGVGIIVQAPDITICTGTTQAITNPIRITERNNNDLSGTGSGQQSFNLILPSGYTFDNTKAALAQVQVSSGGDLSPAPVPVVFLSGSVVQIRYQVSGSSNLDNISVSGLYVTATGTGSGTIFKLGGTVTTISDLTQPMANLTTTTSNPAGLNFTNSSTGPVTFLPDLITTPVGHPKYAVQFRPTLPAGDFGPSVFSGDGVTLDSLHVNAVTVSQPFIVTMTHTDYNGCVSKMDNQYLVYDHTKGLGISTQYCISPKYFPDLPAPGIVYPTVYNVLYDAFPGFYLTSLSTTVVPGSAFLNTVGNNPPITTLPVQLLPGFNPANNPKPGSPGPPVVPATLYYNFEFDVTDIENGTAWSTQYVQTIRTGTQYSRGGSLGSVEFKGLYQSIANVALSDVPLVQNTEMFAPPLAYIEASGNIQPDRPNAQIINAGGSGNIPATDPVTAGHPGTYMFCENSGVITLNGYPRSSSVAPGTFALYDNSNPALPVAIVTSPTYFVDQNNGTATLDPAVFTASLAPGNRYKEVLVTYTYRENASPCISIAKLVLQITPNPVPNFTFSTTCEDVPVNFTDTTPPLPGGFTVTKWSWDFGDANSGALNTSSIQNPSHIYATAQLYSPGVSLRVQSNIGCPSVNPAVTPVNVGGTPTVGMTYTGVAVGDNFSFTATGSGVSSNDTFASLLWTFGDGNTLPKSYALQSDYTTQATTHPYTSGGQFVTDLTVTSGIGCVANLSDAINQPNPIARTLVVLPTASATPGAAYQQNFEATAGGWQAWYASNVTNPLLFPPDPDATPAPSWTYDPTNKTKQIVVGTSKMWATDFANTSGTYNAFERSALYSPSFNLNALEAPMIAFDAVVNTQLSDGLIVEYSQDNKNIADPTKEWIALGTRIGEGVDWFTDKGVAAKPGDQLGNDFGWSGTSPLNVITGTHWIQPKHTIDTIGTTGTLDHVVFRFAFASVSDQPLEGFAVDNIFIGDRTRTILLESFQNTGNSNTQEKAVNDSIRVFPRSIVGTRVVKINYHVNFPLDDPFNLDNPTDPSSRSSYYGITTTPKSRLDGSNDPADRPFTAWGYSKYGKQSLELAQADIVIRPTATPEKISIMVDVDARFNLPANTVLHVAILEDSVSSTESSLNASLIQSGETGFNYILKRLLPTASGTKFGTALLATDPIRTFGPFDYFAGKLYQNPNDLRIVVFLQQEDTKDVFQVADTTGYADPSPITGLEPIPSEKILVYPVPANRELTVQLPGQLSKPAAVQMIDQTGRVTLRSSIPEGSDRATLNVSELSGGVYILTIDMGQGVLTRKKVMVVHQD